MGTRMTVFLMTSILCTSPAAAFGAEWYAEIGVGLTKAELGEPEVRLHSPLIKGVIGVSGDYGWSIELEHISSVPDLERGNGLNAIWIKKRIHF